MHSGNASSQRGSSAVHSSSLPANPPTANTAFPLSALSSMYARNIATHILTFLAGFSRESGFERNGNFATTSQRLWSGDPEEHDEIAFCWASNQFGDRHFRGR